MDEEAAVTADGRRQLARKGTANLIDSEEKLNCKFPGWMISGKTSQHSALLTSPDTLMMHPHSWHFCGHVLADEQVLGPPFGLE